MNRLILFIKRMFFRQEKRPDYFFMKDNPAYSDYNIGEMTYGSPRIDSDGLGTKIIIGKYCSIASHVMVFLGGEHRTDWVTTYPFNVILPEARHYTGHPHTKGDVIIGNDVWIGRGVLILSGVTIGDGAVIGAHCVVSKNMEPYSIVAGNPARHIRYRFEKDKIDKLLAIAWWNWEESKILEAMPLLLNNDIDAFIAKYYINSE